MYIRRTPHLFVLCDTVFHRSKMTDERANKFWPKTQKKSLLILSCTEKNGIREREYFCSNWVLPKLRQRPLRTVQTPLLLFFHLGRGRAVGNHLRQYPRPFVPWPDFLQPNRDRNIERVRKRFLPWITIMQAYVWKRHGFASTPRTRYYTVDGRHQLDEPRGSPHNSKRDTADHLSGEEDADQGLPQNTFQTGHVSRLLCTQQTINYHDKSTVVMLSTFSFLFFSSPCLLFVFHRLFIFILPALDSTISIPCRFFLSTYTIVCLFMASRRRQHWIAWVSTLLLLLLP